MHFSLSALALATSLAFAGAQNFGDIPSCALSCFATAVPASGCTLMDAKCQCTTGRSAITKSVTSCVPSKCSTDDIAKIAPAVQDICNQAGVSVSSLPTAASSGASRTASVTRLGGPASQATSQAAQQTTNAAVANVAGVGALALGVAAVFGL